MAPDEGDDYWYYQVAIFGGKLSPVQCLVSTCGQNFELDKQQGIEALRREESHINR